ncbi:MAG: hypothetical protein IJA91_05555 [Clostridia bacterium]|nr:hypothetical protein [Clostridia bacterium]
MSQKTRGRIHLIYGISLAVLIVAVGVCFALSCLSIYQSGHSPFTRESISTHFDHIAIPTYICIAGVIGGIILSLALPLTGGKVKPLRDGVVALEKLSARLDLASCDEATRDGIRKERRLRGAIAVIAAAVCAAVFVYPLIWCLNPHHFSIENLNDDILAAATTVLTAAAVAMTACMAAVLLRGVSVARETSLVKSALTVSTGISGKTSENSKPGKKNLTADPRFVWAVRGVILVAGIVFVVLGVLNGGMADVLGKAIRICTECIGLG